MALLRNQPLRPFSRGRQLSRSAMAAWQRRAAARREATRVESQHEAWCRMDREDEFWDLFGPGYISQANLPQD